MASLAQRPAQLALLSRQPARLAWLLAIQPSYIHFGRPLVQAQINFHFSFSKLSNQKKLCPPLGAEHHYEMAEVAQVLRVSCLNV